MKIRHLRVWTVLLLLGAAWLALLWQTRESPVTPDPVLDAVEEQPVDRGLTVAMPPSERQRLLAEGVLTNADRPLSALARDPAVIMLRNAVIDTDVIRRGGPNVDIPAAFRASPDYRQAIVVFDQPISQSHRDWLAERGLRVENFIPNRALAVSGPHKTIAGLRSEEAVRHVEPFHPFFKMNRDIQVHLTADADADASERASSGLYHVLLFGDPEKVEANLAAQAGEGVPLLPLLDTPGDIPQTATLGLPGARARVLPRLPDQAVAEIEIDPAALTDLVLAEDVKWIEPVPRFEVMNDLGRESTRQSMTRAVRPALDGSGEIIGVVDTGADVNIPWLADRLVHYEVKASATSDGQIGDLRGHGTHVLGIILGNGALSESVTSAPGSPGPPYQPGQFSGMATNAQYVMIEDFNSFTHPEMAWEAYRRGARIANNSWGAANAFEYGIASMYWDAIVRDVNWGDPNRQPYTVFFAAGNSGQGSMDGFGGQANTVSQPGNAKNVITVGAVEQKRDADNLSASPYFSRLATDSDWQVASYSGRGPVGAQDRRVKPDLVAPGEYVLSLQSAATNPDVIDDPVNEQRDFKSGNVDTGTNYAFMSGTSRATAFASGAAALMRQYYRQGGYLDPWGDPPVAEPSPAMLKALLINGARNLHSSAYEWGPKRDDSNLEIANVTDNGSVSPHPNRIGRWRFENNYDAVDAPEPDYYIDPDPFGISPPVEFEDEDANPGFGYFLRFASGGSVRFEVNDTYINDNSYLANPVGTIEFWIKPRDDNPPATAILMEFITESTPGPQILIQEPNIVTAFAMDATVYVNGSSLMPVLHEGWNHVAVVPQTLFYGTNWVLGNMEADIDELQLYRTALTATRIYNNYTNGLGTVIVPDDALNEQLEGLYRGETVIYDGWGKIDLAATVLGPETFAGDEVVVYDEDVALNTGNSRQFNYNVPAQAADGSLKVTLVWTDVHGTPNAGPMLVNDLDLRVTYEPGTTEEVTYVGNFLGRQTWGIASYPILVRESGAYVSMAVVPGQVATVEPLVLNDRRQLNDLHDRINNVEQIVIRDLLPGNYRIEVHGRSVPVPGDDGGQFFALVISRSVSSAGMSMGSEPALAVDRSENIPVLAYTTPGAGLSQIAVRRWVDRHDVHWPQWKLLEDKWFHYGDGPQREIVSRTGLGDAVSPSVAFGTNGTLYVAWVQRNNDPAVPDAVYLRYLTADRQTGAWDGANLWQQLGSSYQGLGLSGTNFTPNAVNPVVGVAWDDQPLVAYRQGANIVVKKWYPDIGEWRGLDNTAAGLVASTAAAAPPAMAVDAVGYPVLVWEDALAGRLRIVRWSGSSWRPVAGGLLGNSGAREASVACSDFGGIAVSWIEPENGVLSVRVARTTVGGATWSGLGSGAANSMHHPGICGALHAGTAATRLAYTPDGKLLAAWTARENGNPDRLLLKKWNGVQWAGISGSEQMPGIYDTIGSLGQPALVADTNGYPLVALRGVRTGSAEVQILRSQGTTLSDTDPDPVTPTPPPALTALDVFSVDGDYEYGQTIPISVVFADNVTVVGTPILQLLTTPENRYAFYASGSGTDTLVFNYIVWDGDAQVGPTLTYAGSDALWLNSGAFVVGDDWYFRALLPAPGDPGSLSDNNVITVDGANVSLTVSSPWGSVSPPRGLNLYAPGAVVSAAVLDSPVTAGDDQYVATGWSGAGDVPASGSGTNLSFALNSDSTLTWLWATNHWLTTVTNGSGTIAVATNATPLTPNGWVRKDSVVTFTPTADSGHVFAYWQVNGVSNNANPLALNMSAAIAVTGHFMPTTAPGSFDGPDDPPPPRSPQLAIRPMPQAGVELSWNAETGNLYEVEYRLLSGDSGWTVLTNVPFTNATMQVIDAAGAETGGRFYRVRQKPSGK